MRTFAELDENNVVVNVLTIDESLCLNKNGDYSERVGITYLKKFHAVNTHREYITEFGGFRTRPAVIGGTYNKDLDAFIPPKPFPSWILDSSTKDWVSPIGPPPAPLKDGKHQYVWIEKTTKWKLVDFTKPLSERFKPDEITTMEKS